MAKAGSSFFEPQKPFSSGQSDPEKNVAEEFNDHLGLNTLVSRGTSGERQRCGTVKTGLLTYRRSQRFLAFKNVR